MNNLNSMSSIDSRDMMKGFGLKEIETLHSKTLDVLEETGMWMLSDRAADFFKQHGFEVRDNIVHFKPKQVEDALKTCPSETIIRSRNGNRDFVLNKDCLAFINNGGASLVRDYDGTIRQGSSEDLLLFLKLNQMLDEVTFTRDMFSCHADIDPKYARVYSALQKLIYTDKSFLMSSDEEVIDMVSIAYGVSREKMKEDSKKGISYGLSLINPRSPLALESSQSDSCMRAAEHGFPCQISPMPMAGMTAPCTLAGLIVQMNAEIIGAIVLSQLVNPGAPVIYGVIGTNTNMKTTVAPTASPEAGIISYAGVQLANYYGLPTRLDACCSDSNCVDFQAGAESGFHIVNIVRSGGNIINGIGSLGSRGIGSFEKLVLDCELISYARRLIRPVEINEETLAVDLIKQIAPKGNYIAEYHTAEHFRTEFYEPVVFDVESYKNWQTSGSVDSYERAHKRVLELIESYEKPDMDKSIEDDLIKYYKTHCS